jgi:hypothetical protein
LHLYCGIRYHRANPALGLSHLELGGASMAKILFVAAVVFLAVASFVFAKNQANRGYIDRQLRDAPPVDGHPLTVPERHLSYTADDLNAFKNFLNAKTTSDSQTALQFYVSPVLIWNDIIFAVALGCFVVASWLWITIAFDISGILRTLFMFFAAMGFFYGASDVAEDLYLSKLLSRQQAITPAEAFRANALTLTKMATIVSSIQGAVVFTALSLIFPPSDK